MICKARIVLHRLCQDTSSKIRVHLPAYNSPAKSCQYIFFQVQVQVQAQLTSDVDLEILDSKSLLEVFEEANKVVCNILLRRRCWLSDGISSADGLLYPISV